MRKITGQKNRKVLYFMPFLIMGLLMCVSGCQQDDKLEDKKEIIFTTDNKGWWQAGEPITRGALVTSVSNITSFGVSASVYPSSYSYTTAPCGSYFFNTEATPETPTNRYWPPSDYRISFYAYYPYGNSALTISSTAESIGPPTYSYTVPSDIASQVDFLTADVLDASSIENATTVVLTFHQRCAAFRFNIRNLEESAITIHSIGLCGVKYTGTYCAILLIVTSIMMVGYQVLTIADVANGLLFYVGQAFLLVASIFGLDYYIDRIKALK